MIQLTEYQWQQIKNYLPDESADRAVIWEIESQNKEVNEKCPNCVTGKFTKIIKICDRCGLENEILKEKP